MNSKQIFLTLKVAVITIFLFIFAIFLFIAMNESQRLLDGNAISVYLDKNSINISKGKKGFKIEPDVELIRKFINYSYKHPAIIPFPFQFFSHAQGLIYELIK